MNRPLTLRERIKRTQDELGVVAKKSLGQNFLVADHVVEKITAAVRAFGPRALVEVGPGLGSLTESIAALGTELRLIELDAAFAELWRGKGFALIEKDALAVDWEREFAGLPRPLVFVSNLPYQISSRIVIERSLDARAVDGMVLMFQKEVAQRMAAKPGDELYGFLSVVVQTFWTTKIVTEAGPRDFEPPPRVASRVLAFAPKAVSLNRARYFSFLKACFLHPRKLLVSNLASLGDVRKERVTELLEARGFHAKIRAEELKTEDFLSLAGELGYV